MPDRMTVTEEGKADQRAALQDLRVWLEFQGFCFAANHMRAATGNECDWYAYRASELPARECECNTGKRAQIVVTPFLYAMRDRQYTSVEVDLCGQYGGAWFKLRAYSLGFDELRERLTEVEASLIRAWNALEPTHA